MNDEFDTTMRRALQRRAEQLPATGERLSEVLGDVRHRARRQTRIQRTAGALAAVALLGAGALALEPLLPGQDVALVPAEDGPEADDRTTPGDEPAPADETPATPDEDVGTCDGEEHAVAYRVRYPADWWASGGTEACRWFHPEPFDMPEAPRDLPEVAIMVRVEDRPFGEARSLDPDLHELLGEDGTTVDGRDALTQEYVLRDGGLYPEGTTVYRWLVDAGSGRTLSGSTADADVVQADYGDARSTLDGIMRHLTVLATASGPEEQDDAGTACSAAGEEPRPETQELPRPVAETREGLAEAAVACDYGRLVELAGDDFLYSFGDDGDPAGYLRRLEDEGREPLLYLVALLDRPYATVEVQGETEYVWPSAFAHDHWDEVPAEDREALRPLYDEEDFAFFEEFGGYIGYRVGIAEDGRWLFFVAGD